MRVFFSGFMGEWIGARNKEIVRTSSSSRDVFVPGSDSFPMNPEKKRHSFRKFTLSNINSNVISNVNVKIKISIYKRWNKLIRNFYNYNKFWADGGTGGELYIICKAHPSIVLRSSNIAYSCLNIYLQPSAWDKAPCPDDLPPPSQRYQDMYKEYNDEMKNKYKQKSGPNHVTEVL